MGFGNTEDVLMVVFRRGVVKKGVVRTGGLQKCVFWKWGLYKIMFVKKVCGGYGGTLLFVNRDNTLWNM